MTLHQRIARRKPEYNAVQQIRERASADSRRCQCALADALPVTVAGQARSRPLELLWLRVVNPNAGVKEEKDHEKTMSRGHEPYLRRLVPSTKSGRVGVVRDRQADEEKHGRKHDEREGGRGLERTSMAQTRSGDGEPCRGRRRWRAREGARSGMVSRERQEKAV